MFGISFTEIAVILVIALVVVGPDKLPKMMRTLGEWTAKLRRLTSEVRVQTGIDDVLREEGIEGGLSELRGMLRGDLDTIGRDLRSLQSRRRWDADPYENIEPDRFREYPLEGPDSYGALPDDLVDDEEEDLDIGPVAVGEARKPGA